MTLHPSHPVMPANAGIHVFLPTNVNLAHLTHVANRH